MTPRTLATLLLRVFAVANFVAISSAIFTNGLFFQQSLGGMQDSTQEKWLVIGTFLSVILLLVAINAALIIYAPKIAKYLIKEDQTSLPETRLEPEQLLQIGILLIGIYYLLKHSLHLGIATLGWLKEQAAPIGGMESVYNAPMLQNTIMAIIVIALMLRSKSISRLLIRISQ